MITTLSTSGPKAKTIIGASATIGIVWLAITYGTRARSSSFEWTNTAARPMPMMAPTTKPMAASRQV